MIYLILIISVVALILLYKFTPTRKGFMVICTLLIIVFSASAFIHGRQAQQQEITRTQLEELLERQKIFGKWYADYQKDIDRLDRNWQSYHNIIDSLNDVDAQSFNSEALYQRFKELEQESVDEQLKIHQLNAPPELDRENRYLVDLVIRKTQRYVDAQTYTISLSAQAATPPAELETLKLRLHDIMIRESPEGLFTAQEISAIRAALDD